jgi:hypothetical protein
LRGWAYRVLDAHQCPAQPPFAADLKRAPAAALAPKRRRAGRFSPLQHHRQVLSLSGGGRARKYLLTKRLTFALRRRGQDWLPAAKSSFAARTQRSKCSRASRKKRNS